MKEGAPSNAPVQRRAAQRTVRCNRLLGGVSQAPLFLSSHTFGSQSSTLFSSGSMIHANLPFSCDSDPWMSYTHHSRILSSSLPPFVNSLLLMMYALFGL